MNHDTDNAAQVTCLIENGYIRSDRQLISSEKGIAEPFCISDDKETGIDIRKLFERKPKLRWAGLITSPYAAAIANAGVPLRPMLDDMAQIFGMRISCLDPSEKKFESKAISKLSGSLAVIIKGCGILTAAGSLYDFTAHAMVLEKSCRARIESDVLGGGKVISPIEALLMRFIYVMKYSKKADA